MISKIFHINFTFAHPCFGVCRVVLYNSENLLITIYCLESLRSDVSAKWYFVVSSEIPPLCGHSCSQHGQCTLLVALVANRTELISLTQSSLSIGQLRQALT